MQEFIGRKQELNALNQAYQQDSASFIVIYGRRRVGKTTLIQQFIQDKPALYFLGTQELEHQNQKRFQQELIRFTNIPYLEQASFDSWSALFQIFAGHKTTTRKILVIDEFQYLVQINKAFPSIFQEIWDNILSKQNIMVILCGSLISMMTTHVLSYNSPLYGRRTGQTRLQPLPFMEISYAFSALSFSKLVSYYAITSGIPKYISLFPIEKDLFETIEKQVLQRSGYLYEEPFFLLRSEIREPITYFSILESIAKGNHKISAISGSLEEKSTKLSPYLQTLIELGILEKRIPITEKNPHKSRKSLYLIQDYFLRFWFRFVFPNRSQLELGLLQSSRQKLQDNFHQGFVSFVYEDICREIFQYLCSTNMIPFSPTQIGSHWDKNAEFDLVAIDSENQKIFIAEAKFYEEGKLLSMKEYHHLEKQMQDHFPEYPNHQIIMGLFSNTGFSAELLQQNSMQSSLYLVLGTEVITKT